jgi:hypothetical protein
MEDRDALDSDVAWGKPGCCPECSTPFRPGPDQVTSACYALWDSDLNAVRGSTFFLGRCPACHKALRTQSLSETPWEDLDASAIHWCRDYHSPLAGREDPTERDRPRS